MRNLSLNEEDFSPSVRNDKSGVIPNAMKHPSRLNKNSLLASYISLLTASIIAQIIHSQFEAWLVGVGSVQLPLFFFYLGMLVSSDK